MEFTVDKVLCCNTPDDTDVSQRIAAVAWQFRLNSTLAGNDIVSE